MEVKECILSRRSIREFTDEKMTKEDFEKIVEMAAYAPSWKNTQTSRYLVVTDEKKKKLLADECMMGFAGNQQVTENAAALVIVTTVEKRSGFERDGSFSTSKGTHWQSFDAGIASQTFCLAAHSLGFGTVMMGIFDEEKVKKTVSIPEDQSVSVLIAIGHPMNQPQAPKRKEIDTLLSLDVMIGKE